MAAWVKLEKRLITEFRDGSIFRTKVVGFEWFELSKQPPLYTIIREEDGKQYEWCSTTDYHFGSVKPT